MQIALCDLHNHNKLDPNRFQAGRKLIESFQKYINFTTSGKDSGLFSAKITNLSGLNGKILKKFPYNPERWVV